MTSIFEGQPPKTRPFPIKTRVIWVLGMSIYIYLYIFCIYYTFLWWRNPMDTPKLGGSSVPFSGWKLWGADVQSCAPEFPSFVSCFLPQKKHKQLPLPNSWNPFVGVDLFYFNKRDSWICHNKIIMFFLNISIFIVFFGFTSLFQTKFSILHRPSFGKAFCPQWINGSTLPRAGRTLRVFETAHLWGRQAL